MDFCRLLASCLRSCNLSTEIRNIIGLEGKMSWNGHTNMTRLGNHSEFLSLVSLSTDPPQVCHGAGPTTDASHDQAALTALRALSEMGLDSVAPAAGGVKKDPVQQVNQGDGLHMTQSAVQKASGISLGK